MRRFAWLVACLFVASAAHAETFPSKPIRMIVPFPAGSATENFSITINPPVMLTPDAVSSGTVYTPYNQSVTASGGTGAKTFSVAAGISTSHSRNIASVRSMTSEPPEGSHTLRSNAFANCSSTRSRWNRSAPLTS